MSIADRLDLIEFTAPDFDDADFASADCEDLSDITPLLDEAERHPWLTIC